MIQVYLDQQHTSLQRRNFRIKLYFGFALLLLFAALIMYILLYSPIFQIREFKIAGAERLPDDEVLRILQPIVLQTKFDNFLGAKNLLAWDEKEVDVSKTALASAIISRDWLRQSIHIIIQERERLAIWCDMHEFCYWIDRSGFLFEEAPKTEGSLILTVFDSETEMVKGTRVIEDRFSANLTKLITGITELKFPIKKLSFERKLQELRMETYAGPDIFFSIRFDPELNLTSLRTLQEKIGLKGIRYIDLRVENRMYYKNS
jgi:cell division septal protein FtsQ